MHSPNSELRTPNLFRMPAEWARHEATWLTWPKNKITWPGKMLAQVESIYIQMMLGLLPGEKVHLLVPDEKTSKRVLKTLSAKKAKTSNLVPHVVPTVDTWIRDYGPIFVKSTAHSPQITARKGSLSTVDRGLSTHVSFRKFIFNAWGGKYADLATDTGVVDRISYLRSFDRTDIPMILEGGSIDMNGLGTCLTTEQCLLNKNRNPKLSKSQIEEQIKKNLGVTKVIWLKEGIEGDDTDGHVDDITRFVAPRTILTAVEPDISDKNHHYLDENLQILKKSTDQDGRKFKIVELPMPGRVEVGKGHSASGRLPASYANFYIGNHAVLVPVYSHRNDKKAAQIIRKQFPGRKIVAIECTPLVYGLGSIHCVTQQQPK